jgi:hypothetical protein
MGDVTIPIPKISVTAPKVELKKITFGELDKNDIVALERVLNTLTESKDKSFKDAKLTSEDLKVLFRLYKRTDLALPEITFANFYAQWESMSIFDRKKFFDEWMVGLSKNSARTATLIVVISAAVVVFAAAVVVTLVTPMSPFARVNSLAAYCA